MRRYLLSDTAFSAAPVATAVSGLRLRFLGCSTNSSAVPPAIMARATLGRTSSTWLLALTRIFARRSFLIMLVVPRGKKKGRSRAGPAKNRPALDTAQKLWRGAAV